MYNDYESDLERWVEFLGTQWKFVIPETTMKSLLSYFSPNFLFALLWYTQYGNFTCVERWGMNLSNEERKFIMFLYDTRIIGVFGKGMDEDDGDEKQDSDK